MRRCRLYRDKACALSIYKGAVSICVGITVGWGRGVAGRVVGRGASVGAIAGGAGRAVMPIAAQQSLEVEQSSANDCFAGHLVPSHRPHAAACSACTWDWLECVLWDVCRQQLRIRGLLCRCLACYPPWAVPCMCIVSRFRD